MSYASMKTAASRGSMSKRPKHWRIEQVTLIDLLLPHLYRNPSVSTYMTYMPGRTRIDIWGMYHAFKVPGQIFGNMVMRRTNHTLNSGWRSFEQHMTLFWGKAGLLQDFVYSIYTVSWCLVIFSLCHVVALHHWRTKLGSIEFPWTGLHGKPYWAPVC
jgi:hypothetical protein